LLEGVRDPPVRTDVIAAFNVLMEAYRLGRIDEGGLVRELTGLCLDVLSLKYPLRDVEELRKEARRYAEALAKAIRVHVIRERLTRSVLRSPTPSSPTPEEFIT